MRAVVENVDHVQYAISLAGLHTTCCLPASIGRCWLSLLLHSVAQPRSLSGCGGAIELRARSALSRYSECSYSDHLFREQRMVINDCLGILTVSANVAETLICASNELAHKH